MDTGEKLRFGASCVADRLEAPSENEMRVRHEVGVVDLTHERCDSLFELDCEFRLPIEYEERCILHEESELGVWFGGIGLLQARRLTACTARRRDGLPRGVDALSGRSRSRGRRPLFDGTARVLAASERARFSCGVGRVKEQLGVRLPATVSGSGTESHQSSARRYSESAEANA